MAKECNCQNVVISYNGDRLTVSESTITYLIINNNQFQIRFIKEDWEVLNSLVRVQFDKDFSFRRIDNFAKKNIGIDETFEQVEKGKEALSLVRKKVEDIYPEGKNE